MSIRILKNNEKGAVIVLVAIMLLLIVTVLGIVVDLGHIHNVKVKLQEAVDAAALASAAQLDGASGQIQRAKDVAVATAKANGVTEVTFVDAECKSSDTESCIGNWDDTALGSSAGDRWTQSEVSPDAVLVRATRAVDHIFFFFTAATTVAADAIATSEPYNPVLPLALVSCVPTDDIAAHPGSLPPMSICDIKSYSFNVDPEDNAAWTSLTFNVNANEVSQYMTSVSGRERFNKVVFGKGPNVPPSANQGIENTAVDPAAKTFSSAYEGCRPDGLDIPCGLGGKINNKDIASWDEFPAPSPLPALNRDWDPATGTGTGVYSPTGFDPMTGFAVNGYLPRWYNLNPAADFQYDDYFTRVWSQDGVLLPGYVDSTHYEAFTDYQNRLYSYLHPTSPLGTPSADRPYGDSRFQQGASPPGGIGDIITTFSGGKKTQILSELASIGIDVSGAPPGPILFPDFSKVVQYAGYPKVYVFNGTAATILADFLANTDVTDADGNLKCRQDPELPSGQHALVVNVPVIFAGACETWDAISNGSPGQTLSYVGMARMLLTRAWKNPDAYDCGDSFVNVGGCSNTFDPPAAGGGDLSKVTAHIQAIEGVNLYPIPDQLARQASLLKVELVE
jgi:Putative Flp pilus-assembly TadE/G-like